MVLRTQPLNPRPASITKQAELLFVLTLCLVILLVSAWSARAAPGQSGADSAPVGMMTSVRPASHANRKEAYTATELESTSASVAEPSTAVAPTASVSADVTAYIVRGNTRYISTTGNDTSDGLSKSTAWRTLMANLSKIPTDTEVIYLDGFYEFDSNVYFNQGSGFRLPAHVTIRAENYQQSILSGNTIGANDDSDVALAFIDGDVDIEIWGLVFENWRGGHAGTIILENSNDKIRLIGNKFQNNGSTVYHHIFYLSGGDTASSTQRNWVIEDNIIEMAPGSGAFLHIYGGPHGARDGVVKNNNVTGSGFWGILQSNVRPDGSSSNIKISNNTIIGNFSNGVLQFGNYNGANFNGVDASFVVENNRFENKATTSDAYAIWRWPDIGGGKAEHQPTLRNNVLISNNGKSTVLGVDIVDSSPPAKP